MDCAEEVSLLRRELGRISGIRDLSFDVFQGRMTVEFDTARTSAHDIEAAVSTAGMRAEPWRATSARESFWARNRHRILTTVSGVSLLTGLVWQGVETGSLVGSILAHQHGHGGHRLEWPLVALFAIAILAGSCETPRKAWTSIRAGRPDMNALMLFSVCGAMLLGEWSEGATLAFLFSLAARLESWSLQRARDAVGKLLQVAPREATIVETCGDHEHERRMPAEQVAVGALVRVKPGERVPTDGEVERGTSYVNQALITGESISVEKAPGDRVYAGTINEEGTLDIRCITLAQDTMLARMTRMVGESQARRAQSERFIERFTRYYTPAVFALAFGAMIVPPLVAGLDWTQSFYQGMVILLISCPCALVISTPVTVAAALAAAARRGVLIKGGAFLEEAARVRAIAFDKTGVLTRGQPTVERLIPLHGKDEREVLRNLTALERSSEHPLARAIDEHARKLGVHVAPLDTFRALPGLGAEAEMNGRRFWAGSPRLAAARGLETPAVREALSQLADQNHTVVVCGAGDEVWAFLTIADPPRPEARETIVQTRRHGVHRVVMLTGDNEATARSVAAATGVDSYQAELLPTDKQSAVEQLKAGHGHVAMVGDGVNDAQALATASLGISFGRQHADVAMETADVVLMSDDLRGVAFLFRHAHHARRVILQNLVIALALKAAFLVLAVANLATLWMAVAADMGATFLVTLNGLRLLAAGRGAASNKVEAPVHRTASVHTEVG